MKSIEINGKKLSQMTLGTVQLGMNYGIANDMGQPDSRQSNAMLDCALKNGITSLDTARAYGTSEEVLGRFFKEYKPDPMPFITTKALRYLPENATDKDVEKTIFEDVEASLENLGVKKIDCLMIHHAPYLGTNEKIISRVMDRLIKENYISMAGVSIYTEEDLENMFRNDIYQATQIPMSLFDQALINDGYLDRMKEKGIVVFVRSVFLQGLFFMDPAKFTDPHLAEYATPALNKLREFCERCGMSIAEFAISFIRDVPGVTSLVLGADTEEQIIQNIGYMNAPAIPKTVREEATEVFRSVNMEKIMEVLRRPKN